MRAYYLYFSALLGWLVSTVGWAQNLTKLEYFINQDPGYGNGTSITNFTAAPQISTTFPVTIPNTLPRGMHLLSIRAQAADGKWSGVGYRFFYKEDLILTSLPNVTRIEYFIDNDPGWGSGTEIPITQSPTISSITAQIPIAQELSEGFHNLYIRVRDASGGWSVVTMRPFYKDSNLVPLSNLVRIEYFFDNDPGAGNATPVSFTPTPNVSSLIFSFNVCNLTAGAHRFYVRAKDALGRWSILAAKDVTTAAGAVTLNLVNPNDNYPSGQVIRAASQTITATNQLTSTAKVLYKAGNSVTLNPGFRADNGTVFNVNANGCN